VGVGKLDIVHISVETSVEGNRPIFSGGEKIRGICISTFRADCSENRMGATFH